jgi:hypothetical protein
MQMEMRFVGQIAFALLLNAFASAVVAQPEPSASAPIHVRGPNEWLPPQHVIAQVAYSRVVLADAAKAAGATLTHAVGQNGQVALELSRGDHFDNASVRFVLTADDVKPVTDFWGSVSVESKSSSANNDAAEAARRQAFCEQFLNAWLKSLEQSLSRSVAVEQEAQRSLLQAQAEQRLRPLSVISQEIDDIEAKISSAQLGTRLSAATIEKQLMDCLSQRQSLEFELVGLEARRRATESQLAKLAEIAAKQAATDEVITNLEEVVELRKREFDIVEKQWAAGNASVGTREAAKVQIVMAQANLAQARRDAADSYNSELLQQLRADLVRMAVSIEEVTAKLERTLGPTEELQKVLEREVSFVQPLRDRLTLLRRQQESLAVEKTLAQLNFIKAEGPTAEITVRKFLPEPGGEKTEPTLQPTAE